MTVFKMENFGGETPATDDRLLPDNYATVAKNTWVFSGNVEPVHSLVPLHTPSPGTLSWFRLPKGNPGIDNMVDSWWLEFQNVDVRVIRSPVAGQDDDGRYYWADGIYPKMMTGTMIQSTKPLPAPVQNPIVASVVGGTIYNTLPVYYVITALSSVGETIASNEQFANPPLVGVPVANTPTHGGTTGSLPAGTYYYVVTARGTNSSGLVAGETTRSNEVSIVTPANGINVVTWAAVPGASQYHVFRSTTPGTYTQGYAVTGTTFTDVGSAPASISPPATNTALTNTSSYLVSWAFVPNAVGYRVYRGGAAGAENHYFSIPDGGVLSYLDTGATTGTPGTPPTVDASGATPLRLGVPIPEIAPTVTSSGGVSSVNETRTYVYTWVTALGEEGAPSFPTTHTGKLDDTWTIGMTAPSPDDTANRQLKTTRIYRTIVSAQGVATYFFVAEIPITTLTYADTATDAVIVQNEQMKSLFWTAPPADLQGLVSMPNGMVAGWRFNEVWFCEPYYPHAWPITYVIAVPNNIVGLGVYNQSLIILTQGQPYAATGVDPASMALAIVQPLEPCTSRNSIVNTPNGVLYSSPNGLINITPAGAVNTTMTRILKDDWNALLNLDSIAASIIMQGYYAYSLAISNVFQNSTSPPDGFNAFQQDTFQEASHYGTKPGAYISLSDPRIGVNILDPSPAEVQNVITDIFNGETMVMRDGVIYLVDIRQATPYASYLWRSKIWVLPYLQNLGAAKVYFIQLTDPSATGTVFRVYAGEVADLKRSGLPLRHQENLKRSGGVFRLPSGYKALYYQFEIEGDAIVNSIHVGQSPRDLRVV